MVFFMCRYVCLFPAFESKDLHLCQTTLEKLQLLNLFCQKTLRLQLLFALHWATHPPCHTSCWGAGSWSRRKPDWTDSLCWRWPACHQIKLGSCPLRCRPASSSAPWVAAGSAGVRGHSAGLWNTEWLLGVFCCRWRRRKHKYIK